MEKRHFRCKIYKKNKNNKIMAQHININKEKAVGKWNSIMENLGVKDQSKKEWIAEYAEYHAINENVAYANLGNITGMGGVVSSQPSSVPGQTGYGTGVATDTFGNGGSVGSGDYGQQLLPIAMKVAAHTIGLDLVAVKPTPGPVIDLMYVDYRYDDGPTADVDYNPVVFKISGADVQGIDQVNILTTQLRTEMASAGVKETQGGLSQRMFYNLAANSSGGITAVTISGALAGVPNPDDTEGNNTTRVAGSIGAGVLDVLTEPTGSKEGVIEFLGFSRIDKYPMFRAYRTTNATPQGVWRFDRTKNTFGEVESVKEAFELNNASTQPLNTTTNTIGFSGTGTAGAVKVDLISALEDHIHGFATGGALNAMTRDKDENHYPGIIAPNVTTKRVQVGTIEVSSALKITEIEDIKAQTGIDIVQKLESVLVNELSQTISKEIVNKVFEMGDLNRQSAPNYNATAPANPTIFDFDVDAYLQTNAPGGETSQSLQRKLITKVKNASNYIATEGRIGPATYLVTNGTLAGVLTEGTNYSLSPESGSANAAGQLYPAGKVAGITIYVDPYMVYNDNRILLGRKNNADQPGIIFVPYLMAQSVNLISEATFAPRMLLRSRYAVTEIGFFPQKQYMTIQVNDPANRLA
jgi:hypothetical protein